MNREHYFVKDNKVVCYLKMYKDTPDDSCITLIIPEEKSGGYFEVGGSEAYLCFSSAKVVNDKFDELVKAFKEIIDVSNSDEDMLRKLNDIINEYSFSFV